MSLSRTAFSRKALTSMVIASAVVLAPVVAGTSVPQADGGSSAPVSPTSDERNGPH